MWHYCTHSFIEAGEGFLQEYEDRNGGSLSSNLECFAERHKSVEEGQGKDVVKDVANSSYHLFKFSERSFI